MGFFLSASLGLVGCSQTKSTTDALGRGPTGNTTQPSMPTGPLTECTRFPQNSAGLLGSLSTYYNGGQLVDDYIQMNMTQFPASYLTSTGYAQIFRWKESQAGQRQGNSVPVRFFYVSKVTGQSLTSEPYSIISRSDIENLIKNQRLNNLGITLTNFFNHHYVLLTGMEYQWQAVSFAFYDTRQGSTALATADGLLPPVLANPNSFALRVSANVRSLHPLMSIAGSGASDQEYKRLGDEICLDFFNQPRAPSSVDQGSGAAPSSWLGTLWGTLTSLVRGLLHNLFGL
jgi:hypothetical protein